MRSLRLTRSYDGMLLGSRKVGGARILKMLQEQARRIKPPQSPLLVITPEKLPLPDYMWTVELESRKAVRTNDPDFSSHLSVCWFSEDLRESIDTVIASHLVSVNWTELATDYDFTFH